MSRRTDGLDAFYAPLAGSTSAARRAGWEDEHAHRLRLEAAAAAIAPLEEVGSVLDAGCGEGALWDVLQAAGYAGAYRGEDLRPQAIAAGLGRRPAASLVVADATDGAGPPADAVVACGTFNTVDPERSPDQIAAAGLAGLWARTRSVLVIDVAVLDRHAPGVEVAAIDLGALWSYARTLSRAVTVREDLVPGEAQLVLRRDRGAVLRRLMPGRLRAVARARMLLAASELGAARSELQELGRSDAEAALCLAVVDAASGRWRDAERSLRGLIGSGEQGGPARVHLAALLDATRRRPEAAGVLEPLVGPKAPADVTTDETRLLLSRWRREAGDEVVAAALLAAIRDPWIRREGRPGAGRA